ncbi:MAG: ACT domain-containing protein [Clostridiales bacterium]|nr:ACT domain-containing protein [Clostridiales bacterium]MBR6483930.1 ACT domain-containing protein [Clostridiales bacterium]
MASGKNTAVISVIGKDKVGIIAKVSNLLADNNININDISQTILDDIFTMIMLVDLQQLQIEESDIKEKLNALGEDLGVTITIQHTDLFDKMHRI